MTEQNKHLEKISLAATDLLKEAGNAVVYGQTFMQAANLSKRIDAFLEGEG